MRSGGEFGCAFWDTRLPATSSSGTLPHRYAVKRAMRALVSRELVRPTGTSRSCLASPWADVPGHPDVARPGAARRRCSKSQWAGYRSADEADVDTPNATSWSGQRLYSGTTAPVPASCVVTAGSPRYWIVPVPVSVASSVPVALTRMVPVPWSCAVLLVARRS